jgi:predicted enzyme related to lactoylglutathione lyase
MGLTLASHGGFTVKHPLVRRIAQMKISKALTTIYVKDYEKCIDWYTEFFGRSFDAAPEPNCREWEVVQNAFLQVIESTDMPSGHAAFIVNDLSNTESRLKGSGISVEKKKIGNYEVT